MKKTKFIYILLCFIMFFCFSSRVYADSFTCVYPLKKKLSIMIVQNGNNKPVYKISTKGATSPDDESWKLKSKTKYSGVAIYSEHGSYDTPYKVCPGSASYYKPKTGVGTASYRIDFRTDKMSDEYAESIKQGQGSMNKRPSYNDSSNQDEIETVPSLIQASDDNIDTCEKLFGSDGKLVDILKSLLVVMRILVPIIIIGMGIVDMVQGIFASDEQQMKKAQSKFMKRLIIGVAFFMIPSVLKVLLTIGSLAWPDIVSSDFCGIL